MRPFRFLAEAAEPTDGRSLAADARRAESIGYSVLVIPDHLDRAARADPGDGHDRRRDRAAPGRDVRAQQRPPPPGRPGPGPGHGRPAQRRPAGDRDRGGLAQARVRRDRPPVRPGRRPGQPARGGDPGPQGLLRRWLVQLPAVQHYTISRPRRPAEAGSSGPIRRSSSAAARGASLSLAAREADVVGLAPRLLPGDQSNPRADPRSITLEATAEKIGWVSRGGRRPVRPARARTSTRRSPTSA